MPKMGFFMRNDRLKADLRVFGAIGFQDAPNGLWMGVHGYNKNTLLEEIIKNCLRSNTDIVAITTEDDKIQQGYPEDRFGFLLKQISLLPECYSAEKIDDILMRVRAGSKIVYLVNSETVHAPKDANWGGVKVHLIGRNARPANLTCIADVLNYSRGYGLVSFLMNTGISNEAKKVAEAHVIKADGIISHDANNVFPDVFSRIPVLRKNLGKYTKSRNKKACQFAELFHVPGIAVSSAHYMHEIGNAGITLDRRSIVLTDGIRFLSSLRKAIDIESHVNLEGYNKPFDVLTFGCLLGKYGSAPDRFKGGESSYNQDS